MTAPVQQSMATHRDDAPPPPPEATTTSSTGEPEEEALVFDESPKSKPVVIRSGTTKKRYLLKEMMGDALSEWMKNVMSRIKVNRSGRQTGDPDFREYHASLICLCLYDAETDKPVQKAVVRHWPSTTLNGLFKACQEMNGLTDDSLDAEKKS